MAKRASSFRVGNVRAYLRGKIWYLCYHENGARRRPRVGSDKQAAKQAAAQINAQLQIGAPAAFSFEPIGIAELRACWLQHHELVLRSSLQTINRYRTATDHLLRFLEQWPVRNASLFRTSHAEEFVRYLRTLHVSPNGHANTAKRPLMDKGLRYVLECCRALFNYAAKRRHLPPYADNPFRILEIEHIPIDQARPIVLFDAEQEKAFLKSCDDWQFPLFLLLSLTGIRPGELCHLLLPDDIDLNAGLLRVRNKPRLGWQIKTRNERDIPLVPVLVDVLRCHVGCREAGPLFHRRRWSESSAKGLISLDPAALEKELAHRISADEIQLEQAASRKRRLQLACKLWRELGAVKTDLIRTEFMRLTREIGLPSCTAPKLLRHQFATALQEGRVDPLIRNQLMGHAAAGERNAGYGLGMTAVYTHSRPEISRQQLEDALANRPAVAVAKAWLARRSGSRPS